MNAVFLSGGGARGAYEVGVLKALMRHGPPLKMFGGASVGAINAVLAATGQLDEVAEVWPRLSTLKIYRPRYDVWNLPHWASLMDVSALEKRLREEVRWERLEAGGSQVFISATNLTLRGHQVFSGSEVTYRHVLASSAIPVLFPPVNLGGHWYVDGAFTLVRPLWPLLEAGADRIFTVFLSPRRPRFHLPRGLFDLADRVLEILLSSAIAADRDLILKTNQELILLAEMGVPPDDPRRLRHRMVEMISIYPSQELGQVGSYFTFSGETAQELIALGMEDACKVLKRHKLYRAD